jgi:hypothetical protein
LLCHQAIDAETFAAVVVVNFAVIACVCQELREGHAGGGCARQRWQIGEVAARARPDPLRQQDLRRD